MFGDCDLCGKKTELVEGVVEGSILKVCNNCIQFGEAVEIKKSVLEEKSKPEKIKEEIIEEIVRDYSTRIKGARESMNLLQKDLAMEIAEKESVIHNLESGHLEPSLDLAKKLEGFLNIKLIVINKNEKVDKIDFHNASLTIGDLLKLNKDKHE
ncbi:TIGR00270 family protein [archaeon]|nr:TIGR00270 family protein [archaeon]|tara:strand:+ start:532 stop:993 length:462 start_codon:yes stop_codon:yes gene_type:complete